MAALNDKSKFENCDDVPKVVQLEGTVAATETKVSKTKKLFIGILLVILIAVSQTGAQQFAKQTWTPDFKAPFFITWFSAVCLVICYPVYLFLFMFNFKRKEKMRSQTIYGSKGLTVAKYFTHGGLFSFLAVGTNYAYVRALQHSHVSDVTALFASNAVFVFVLSCILLKADIISLKIISIILAVCGIVLIAAAEGFHGPSFWGTVLSIGAAFGAACYTVFFKKVIGNAKPDQVCLFLSVVASFTAMFFWPIILILHYSEHEIIVPDNIPWRFLGGSSSLSVVFNFLINFGVAYTYPLFIAFGGIVSIPLNNIVDWTFRGIIFDPSVDIMKIVGTVSIISAFILIVMLPVEVDKQFQSWVISCGGRRKPPLTADHMLEESAHLRFDSFSCFVIKFTLVILFLRLCDPNQGHPTSTNPSDS